MRAWDVCDAEPTKTGAAFGGLDLSATTDLTAFTDPEGSAIPRLAGKGEHERARSSSHTSQAR